jgi:CPA2 family monovalent cation:H+ antiporter-2
VGGRTLDSLALHAMGVRVVSLRRGNGHAVEVIDDLVLMDGDTLVLSGRVEPLARAEERLLGG